MAKDIKKQVTSLTNAFYGILDELEEDLASECEDNDVMRECIRNHFSGSRTAWEGTIDKRVDKILEA